MFICLLSPNKKKNKTKQKKKFTQYSRLVNLSTVEKKKICILFIKGTRAWYTRVLCCMVLKFTKLEYHIIFFNRANPTQQCHDGTTDEELEFLKLEFWKKW